MTEADLNQRLHSLAADEAIRGKIDEYAKQVLERQKAVPTISYDYLSGENTVEYPNEWAMQSAKTALKDALITQGYDIAVADTLIFHIYKLATANQLNDVLSANDTPRNQIPAKKLERQGVLDFGEALAK